MNLGATIFQVFYIVVMIFTFHEINKLKNVVKVSDNLKIASNLKLYGYLNIVAYLGTILIIVYNLIELAYN